MDWAATRNWGIAVSGAMIAGALALAATAPDRAGESGVPWISSDHGASRDLPEVVADSASAPEAAASETLIVRFRGNGPLARAARAHSGRRVAAELERQRAFAGLCFERFVRSDVVLRSCQDEPLGTWPQRLRAMRAVARVEAGE